MIEEEHRESGRPMPCDTTEIVHAWRPGLTNCDGWPASSASGAFFVTVALFAGPDLCRTVSENARQLRFNIWADQSNGVEVLTFAGLDGRGGRDGFRIFRADFLVQRTARSGFGAALRQ